MIFPPKNAQIHCAVAELELALVPNLPGNLFASQAFTKTQKLRLMCVKSLSIVNKLFQKLI